MNKSLSINENYSLALKNYNMRNFIEAEIFCKKILSINSNHFESIWLMGLMSIREKKFKIANNFFLQAANIKPNNEKIYNNLGNIEKELRNFDSAIKYYKKAIEIQPNNANAYYNLGNVYKELKNFNEALKNYYKATSIKSDYFYAYYSSGNIEQQLGNFENAKKFYKKTLEIEPNHVSAYNNLGLAMSKLGEFSDSIKYFSKAIEIKPNHVGAHINLGLILTELGKFSKAINIYEAAIKHEPENLNCYYYLSNLKKEILDLHLKKKIEKILSKREITKINLVYGNFLLSKYKFNEKNYNEEMECLIKAHSNYLLSIEEHKKEISYWLNESSKTKNIMNQDEISEVYKKETNNIKPIFIIGVPKCGSTLIEKIITSGPKKLPTGEETSVLSSIFKKNQIYEKSSLNLEILKNFREEIIKKYTSKKLINSESNFIFTDKSLENFLFLDLIKIIFPKAKVINCQRDPISSIISIFKSNLTGLPWAHNLEHIFKYFDIYFNKMKYYQKKMPDFIYNLNLENFVNEPVAESKKLMNFCELSWDVKCLEYYKREDLISKTTSNIQIRKAIYKNSTKKYEPYKKIIEKYNKKYFWLN